MLGHINNSQYIYISASDLQNNMMHSICMEVRGCQRQIIKHIEVVY